MSPLSRAFSRISCKAFLSSSHADAKHMQQNDSLDLDAQLAILQTVKSERIIYRLIKHKPESVIQPQK